MEHIHRSEGPKKYDVSIFQGYDVGPRVFTQISRLGERQRIAYYAALSSMLEKDPGAKINDIEDIRLPGMPPALPGTDRRQTSVMSAAGKGKATERAKNLVPDDNEPTRVRSSLATRPAPKDKYTGPDMTLNTEDILEGDEEDFAALQKAIKDHKEKN